MGGSQVDLSWTAPTSGSPATSYNIYEGTSTGGESADPSQGTTGTSVSVTGLAAGTTYYFQVTAVDAGVAAKATVFVSQQQFQISRIDANSGIDRQTPAAVGHRIGAQQFAVAIDDRGGDFACLRQRQWAE